MVNGGGEIKAVKASISKGDKRNNCWMGWVSWGGEKGKRHVMEPEATARGA